MHYQPIEEYLKSRKMRQETPYCISEGKGYYMCKGMLISEKEFEEAWPLGDRVLMHNSQWKGDNPDKTHV